jgi:hypothetical protein
LDYYASNAIFAKQLNLQIEIHIDYGVNLTHQAHMAHMSVNNNVNLAFWLSSNPNIVNA